MDPSTKLLAYTIDPGSGTGFISPSSNSVSTLERIISQVFGVLSIVAFIFFVFQIIFAGYALLSSGGDPKKAETARARLTDSILGLVIVVVAVGLGALIAKLAGIPNIFDLNAIFTNLNQ